MASDFAVKEPRVIILTLARIGKRRINGAERSLAHPDATFGKQDAWRRTRRPGALPSGPDRRCAI